jgi:hypothetical protein
MKINSLRFEDLNRKKFPGSMDPSEIYSFIYLLNKKKIDLVIESGRQYGYSTYFIGKYSNINNIKFYSIDLNIDKKITFLSKKNLSKIKINYVEGNFFFVIRKILDIYKYKKIALLVDGPKGLFAYCYCYSLLINYKNLKFVFFDNFIDYSNNLLKFSLFKKINNFHDLRFPLNIRNKLIYFNNKNRIKNSTKDNDFSFISKYDLNLNYFFFCLLIVIYYFMKLKLSRIIKSYLSFRN